MHANLYSNPWGGARGRTKGGSSSQFHSTISPTPRQQETTRQQDAQTTRGNNDCRDSCPPQGDGPLTASQSKLFKPFHAFSCQTKPFQERQNAPILPLNSSKSALSFWSVSALQEFCDSGFAEGSFSWIARIEIPRVEIIGFIFPAFAFVC